MNSVLQYIHSGKLLDVGCGYGEDSIFFAKKGFNVTGIDNSEYCIHKCENLAKIEKVSVKFVIGDAKNYDFRDKFDIVLMKNVLHFVDLKKTIEKMKEITNGGGINVIIDEAGKLKLNFNNFYSDWEILDNNSLFVVRKRKIS